LLARNASLAAHGLLAPLPASSVASVPFPNLGVFSSKNASKIYSFFQKFVAQRFFPATEVHLSIGSDYHLTGTQTPSAYIILQATDRRKTRERR
jgi:hypothetical protein